MLNPTDFDRFAMGFSLAVHILVAVVGVALPLIILLADYLWIRRGDRHYRLISDRFTTALVVLFAVGTGSGMLVAINLLFLWPKFMALVSQVSMAPVYMEVFAFFIETIFLTIYVFYRDTFKDRRVRLVLMLFVAIGGAASAGLITVLNSFMNTPVGFNVQAYMQNGIVTGVNPLAVFIAPATLIEIPHVIATSYLAGTGIFMAYFAIMLLRSRDEKHRAYYRKGLKLTFWIFLIATFLSVLTGVLSVESLYYIQPEKYAAIELNLNSTAYAPELIGGIYQSGHVAYALAIPEIQSILATGSVSGVVPGLDQYQPSTWPPLVVHLLFDVMVAGGFALAALMLVLFAMAVTNRHMFENRKAVVLLAAGGILSVILMEMGWMVDEIGRQPWIIYNVMTVQQAANQSVSIIPLAILIVLLYALIIPITFVAIRRIFLRRALEKEL